jgi:hypothetical protein
MADQDAHPPPPLPTRYVAPRLETALYETIVPLPSITNVPDTDAPTEPIRYYTCGERTVDGRGRILAALLAWSKKASFDSALTATWVWSCIACAFPALPEKMLTTENLIAREAITITDEQYRYFTRGTLIGSRPAVPATDENPAVEAIEGVLPVFSRLPGLTATDTTRKADVDEAIAVLAILIFAIGKQATQVNMSAFNVNRPRAFKGKEGIEIKPHSPLHSSQFPNLVAINRFSGHFGSRTALRIAFTMEVIRWTVASVSHHQEIVATQVKLWQGVGLTHMDLVRSFMVGYHQVVAQIPGLLGEIREFERVYREFGSMQDPFKWYTKVILKDRATLGDGRRYKGLQALARQIASRIDTRYNNYAVNLGSSVWIDEFERLCREMGYALPAGGTQFAAVPTV